MRARHDVQVQAFEKRYQLKSMVCAIFKILLLSY